MSLEQEIADWAASRPAWQRSVLGKLAAGQALDVADFEVLARQLADGRQYPPAAALVAADFPGAAESGQCTRLIAVKPVAHVNALLAGEQLTFGTDGLTVVYGDNASGKSGYARLIKKMVRARHQEDVLTNIFEDDKDATPAAVVSFETGGERRDEPWPGQASRPLGQVSFYDEACGAAYITTESDVTYRPSALSLLDGLIRACDMVRDVLDGLVSANAQAKVELPAVEAGTAIADFLSRLSPATTESDIDAACALPGDADTEIARLAQEEARLRQSDPVKERTRLTDAAGKLDALAGHLAGLDGSLGRTAEEKLRSTRQRATGLRAAAEIASSKSFDAEPLPGVGSETWRALWDAARRFSEAQAYPGQDFPVTTVGRCVLCQQDLSAEAADRLHRFHSFMTDDTEKQAATADEELRSAIHDVSAVIVMPTAAAQNLAALEASYPELVTACRNAVQVFERRKPELLTDEEPATPVAPVPPAVDGKLRTQAAALRERARAVDTSEFQRLVTDVTGKRSELEGRRAITATRGDVLREIGRLKERAKLETAKRLTDTTGITRKSAELAREHATAVVRDRFTRESDRLKLERITLQDTGGRKGQLRQRPAFLGAAQRAGMPQVLSRGEQTALGLVGYLTEAFFDQTHSALVLDDPVTSLGHDRRAHIANRLAQFAQDRQVIVFTHDVTFVGDLRKAAEREGITFTERCVERRPGGSIGVCRDQHPWKVKDVRSRLGQLETQLARIKREHAQWDAETYEKETADWAGKLSETWERMIHLEIVNQVVDRSTSEVRPKMFRMLARITEADDREFQESYGRCSLWARRHDKCPEVSYVPPEIAEMEAELGRIRTWFDRIRKYSS